MNIEESKAFMRFDTLLSLASAVVLSACSGTDSSLASVGGSANGSAGGSGDNGGTASLAGASAIGGGLTTGGVAATAGSGALGGTTATGGAGPAGGTPANTGGLAAAGGLRATGGTTVNIAGSPPTGGSKSTGGSSPAGGSSGATGGNSGAAGSSSTGGTRNATGGSAASGGSLSTGGSTPAGGSASCVESNCGSHKWACWKVGTPPSEKLPNPQSLTDLGNGTVRDNNTCLVWEKANPATQGNWQASFDRCAALASSNYGGYGDWRLPTRMEMASITDLHSTGNGFASPFTVTSGYYTTGSQWYETITGQSTSGFIWGYGGNGFTSNAIAGSGTNLVARCVRGNGKGEAADQFAVEPANHYTITSGEVLDNYTGLTWQQGFSDTMAHDAAATYCSALSINGHTGFRLPTLMELASTVNEALVGGAINRTAFPNNPNGCKAPEFWFWASEAYNATTFWGLSYCDGFTGWNAGASGAWNYFPTARVRCVRN